MTTTQLQTAIELDREDQQLSGMRATRNAILADYEHDSSPIRRITQPGKFEGEPIFTPWLWQCGLDGCADSDNGKVYGFRFSNDCPDFKVWPELKAWLGRKRAVKLSEDSQGFVHAF